MKYWELAHPDQTEIDCTSSKHNLSVVFIGIKHLIIGILHTYIYISFVCTLWCSSTLFTRKIAMSQQTQSYFDKEEWKADIPCPGFMVKLLFPCLLGVSWFKPQFLRRIQCSGVWLGCYLRGLMGILGNVCNTPLYVFPILELTKCEGLQYISLKYQEMIWYFFCPEVKRLGRHQSWV